MERPLPDDVARPARAHLAALLPADEVSDAWHELLADVAYWDERELLPVLRLAHQVVVQHARVSPEAAALVLVDNGIDRPEDVATVLDADVEHARTWTRAALDTRDDPPRSDPPTPWEPASGDDPARDVAPAHHAPADPAPVASADPAPAGPSPDEPAPSGEAVRIGFDADDGPMPDLEGRGGQARLPVRTIVLAGVVLVALVAVLWALAG